MAITYSYGFTNETVNASGLPLKHYDLGPTTDYALKVDEPEECQLSNTTTPVDRPEVLTYQATTVSKIPTKITVQNPPKVSGGIMYGVRLDEVLHGVSSTDDSFAVDLPIVLNLSVKHPMSSAITTDDIDKLISRLVSALYTEDNKSRIGDLMRSALKPTVD